uniref:non-specific serine/threonine protein kinase n=1 Tax=Thermosporothrix sp. COM3 TaxID=2490863 RepID=A0A455SQ17_9CHLR|nr:hypothetical protein KTC_30360 [Thermosporothrix sp. COM3]
MHDLVEGQKFAYYRINRSLGSGAAGKSYLAEDTRIARMVLLKLLHPWYPLSDQARRQFFRDAQALSVITHPLLTPILDYGDRDGYVYIARPYLEAGSLLGPYGRTQYRPPLTVADAVRLTTQLAQTLDALHTQGYAHGSLTFSNILVLPASAETPLIVSDAWCAMFVRKYGQPQSTPLPIIAAPEQYRLHTLPESDQYALASLFYFWLSGRPPFFGMPKEVLQFKLNIRFTALSRLNPAVPRSFDAVMTRALQAAPERRYPSTREFTDALLHALTQTEEAEEEDIMMEETLVHKVIVPPPTGNTPKRPLLEDLLAAMREKPQQEPRIEPDIAEPIPTPEPTPPQIPEPTVPYQPEPEEPPDVRPPLPPQPDVPEPIPVPPTEPVVPEPMPGPPTRPTIPEPHPVPPAAPNIPEPSPAPPAEPPKKQASLLVLSPYQGSHEIPLHGDLLTVGRAGSSTILLERDNLTSRHHAVLRKESGYYTLYDQQSAKGVFVNGQRLLPGQGYRLQPGDRITIGRYTLIYQQR